MDHRVIYGQKGRKWVFFDRIDSTNAQSVTHYKDWNLKSGDIVYTDDQFQGRGQRGKTWLHTPKHHVAMTYYWVPTKLDADKSFIANQAVALAVCDALHHWDVQTHIKWPNDIYVGDQKVAGILIQNILKGKSVERGFVGIGINVKSQNFSSELPNPAALEDFYPEGIASEEVMHKTAEALDIRLRESISGSLEGIREEYLKRMYLKGIETDFTVGTEHIRGTIIGVQEDGQLLVQIGNQHRSFLFGQLTYGKSINPDNR